ncbi:V-type ATP synthase subunit D [Tichowtungia aerotolerans]|uniref:V-type ATP synthase subunit D n=1 Tax=Tichowtungia aerotolerans TaxID=2697043 RepID=A0A6P1M812_9BACT|nr:V-type ATP synthase subunit D [Tichowtungia aerotolerans]QHI69203.1 V-type ATP synthase subunit D [Tichowtungia aerotolerans]
MAKIKYTKNELKAQRDALTRFTRYLPTLQLKKQQLQVEMRALETQIEAKRGEENTARSDLASWVKLFSEPFDFMPYIQVDRIERSSGNIAGVAIPIFGNISFVEETPDLFETAAWVDRGIDLLRQLIRLRVERQIIEEQHRLLSDELRTTSQRVNLFEKVKIPECKENIRVIRIFMGDQQTAAVARSKIAKGKSSQKETAA